MPLWSVSSDALHKQKIYLDAFANGLEVLGVKSLISQFPEVFKPLFISDGKVVEAKEVVKLLKPTPSVLFMYENQCRI